MEIVNDLITLSFAELVRRCQEETANYFKTQLSDSRYCYEIFRQALVERSQPAWDAIYQQYRPLVLHWLQRGNRLAKFAEEPDALLNETFAKFWSAVSPEKFAAFAELKSVLRYLELCTGSVVLDWLRRKRIVQEEEDPEAPDQQAPLNHAIENQELFAQINQRHKDEDEKLVFFALFSLGMKPNEICEEWSQRFPTVQRVNQIRQNIVGRLQRDESLRRYYAAR